MKECLKQNKLLLAVTVLLCVVSSAAYVYIAIVLQDVTNASLSGNMASFRGVLARSVIYLLLLSLLGFVSSLFNKKLTKNLILLLRQRIFHGILRRNAQDFANVNTADYISACTNDVKLVEENFISPSLAMLQSLVLFIGAFVVLFTISPFIALFLIGCLVLMLLVPSLFGKALQGRQGFLSQKLSEFTGKLKDFMAGYEVIKSYGMEGHVKTDFERQNAETAKAKYAADRLFAVNESISAVLAYMTLFSGFFIGAYLLIEGKITAGILLALIQLSSTIVNPIMVIMQNMTRISSVKPVLKRLEEYSDYDGASFTGVDSPAFEKQIAVRNLSFKYGNGDPVLQNASITIEKNKKYAIVGRSGCGKTTLIKLLTGFYSNFEGEVSYDGTDIRKLDIEQLHRKISVIHQNIYMFDDSVRQNICLYGDYGDGEMNAALKASGVDQFLERMPNGMDSPVGENGSCLSGGQRQRVAVARALIRKKPILILDEGTSAIDMQTGYDIESRLLGLGDLTLITITHNLSENLLKLYDKIIYMEDGSIEETGSLDELLSRQGAFSRFFRLQTAEETKIASLTAFP